MPRLPVALQMYTLRDEMAADFVGTLRNVADIGYDGAELLPPPEGMTARELRSLLDELGLRTPGIHAGLEAMEADLSKAIDFSLELGAPCMIIPGIRQDMRDSADAWRATAQRLTQVGEEIAQHGMTLCYHNHSFEFERLDGESGFDILWQESDPRYVQSELDVYWVRHGGESPVAYLEKLANRVPLVHLKDMATDGSFAEVGEGLIDWEPIFSTAEKSGAQWYVVEQDTCQGPPIESVRISLENLRQMGKLG